MDEIEIKTCHYFVGIGRTTRGTIVRMFERGAVERGAGEAQRSENEAWELLRRTCFDEAPLKEMWLYCGERYASRDINHDELYSLLSEAP